MDVPTAAAFLPDGLGAANSLIVYQDIVIFNLDIADNLASHVLEKYSGSIQ